MDTTAAFRPADIRGDTPCISYFDRVHDNLRTLLPALVALVAIALATLAPSALRLPLGIIDAVWQPQDAASGNWELTLVNANHPIPWNFEVETIELRNGQAVDVRCYPDLQDMFDACRAAGLDPKVNSSYRTRDDQQQVLDEKIAALEGDGYQPFEAERLARETVAAPGHSEHELGLAVDVCSERNVDAAHAEVQAWMAQNSWEYGWVVRYPQGKEEITGIAYEPWHLRYVGQEAAREMHESGLCLEEYLAQ